MGLFYANKIISTNNTINISTMVVKIAKPLLSVNAFSTNVQGATLNSIIPSTPIITTNTINNNITGKANIK